MITAVKKDKGNKLREQIYLWLLKNCTEDEISNVQRYYMERCPPYILNTEIANTHYIVLTCVASEIGMYEMNTMYFLKTIFLVVQLTHYVNLSAQDTVSQYL